MPVNNTWKINIKGDVEVSVPADINNQTTYILLEQEDWCEPEIEFIRKLVQPGTAAIDTDSGYGVYVLTMARQMQGRGRVVALNTCEQFAQSLQANKFHDLVVTEQDSSNLDFIRLGGTEQDAGLISQGEPLVMFPAWQDLVLFHRDQGMDIYRLIPGLNVLVRIEEEFGLQGNLFACTEKKAWELENRGLLVGSPEQKDVGITRKWQEVLPKLPYTQKLFQQWSSSTINPNHEKALNQYLSAMDLSLKPSERYSLLGQSLSRIQQDTSGHIASTLLFIRILRDLGRAGEAAQRTSQLLKEIGQGTKIMMDRPFLPPLSTFDNKAMQHDLGSWLSAAIMESLEKYRALTSYHRTGNHLPLLIQIYKQPDHSLEMERRLALCAMRTGEKIDIQPTSRLITGNHLNRATWKKLANTESNEQNNLSDPRKVVIQDLIDAKKTEEAGRELDKWEREYPYDIDIHVFKGKIALLEGRMEQAESVLLEGLQRNQLNYKILYSLGELYDISRNYQKAYEYYYRALRVAECDAEKERIKKILGGLRTKDPQIDTSFTKVKELQYFPIKTKNSLYLFDNIYDDREKKGYYPLVYQDNMQNIFEACGNTFTTETLFGEKYDKIDKSFFIEQEAILPVGIKDSNTELEIRLNNQFFAFQQFHPYRFNHFKIPEKTNISIKSKSPLILGNPLPVKQQNNTKYDLVLCIFIDGFSQIVLENHGCSNILPNTYHFFNNGTYFTNCYSNAEWTLASVASLFSGRYTVNHKVFHNLEHNRIGNNYPIISEYFQENGYMTHQVCGNWRKNPAYGYARGFDRTVFQKKGLMGMQLNDVIFNFLEHIGAFPERKHFAWLTLFELQQINYNKLPELSSQVNCSIESLNLVQTLKRFGRKSPFTPYDKLKINRYINELKRIDFYLKLIFNFIEENYFDNNYLVCLVSDHGQQYLATDSDENQTYYDNQKNPLSQEKTKVPFFITGRGIPEGQSEDIIENADILPTLLNLCDIEYSSEMMDGKPIKALGGQDRKEFVYTESLFPEQTYKACIRDKVHAFFLESEYPTRKDGGIALGNYFYSLKDFNGRDIKSDYPEKTKKYIEEVFKHIQDYIIL